MSETTQGVQLNFRDDKELYELLTRYKNSMGWTWKRFFLVGVAESLAKQSENPDLVVRIVNYLDVRR